MTSSLAKIEDFPSDPVEFFKKILQEAAKGHPDGFVQEMNLATVDEEFGVLNRTVLYRGLTQDNCVFYITHRYVRNFKNLRANPKACITFYMPDVKDGAGNQNTWQVRLIGATAVELAQSEMDALWAKENLAAQIRGHICPCGEPINYDDLKAKHDQFLQDHRGKSIERPASYTAWKFQPQRWDFLKVGLDQIADRVQYRLQKDGKWASMHVST
ncbi:pyridoxine/pyridoxamine 5'-phosphate oxidase [Drosophila sechellia]|uniref:pyridoxal 5'-phosphate synthase n=1 Tax=Drosophila sechellia TaxID=7238 RepID=B4IJU3_DROSE|nr:pyridoxine/pyridoxamine 5'-phosphate oxidase [Drosophila sechellia]XP_032582719.1 pyridoxine/pyridoxamine 5'-phosphate oxidase [Drosophila sechellia]EDW51299.1 GM21452 [Drosophila sechellia]